MCALCISDVHGNLAKVKAFLEYKPDEEHIIIGDLFDSYLATDHQIIRSIEYIMDHDVTLICGNHDLVYLPNAHWYFECTGNRRNPEFRKLMRNNLDRFQGSLIRNNHLICHGGLSKFHGKKFDDIVQANFHINEDFNNYINSPVMPESLSWIFDIGSMRGGRQQVGGIFWLSFGYEKYDTRFNQVCGHTKKKEPQIIVNKESIHVCIDSPKFICYNTETRELEDFFPDKYIKIRDKLEIVY
jgi:UDP-2,3-diacylglucosamine pyrophosphatase LpxH